MENFQCDLAKHARRRGMNYQDQLNIYDQIVAESGLERKGKTMPYTSANGYMFSQLNKAGEIGIRLSKEAGKKFLEAHPESGPFKSYGATMREYVLIPNSLLSDVKLVASYLLLGHQYVNSLNPK
jgi:hypothetical protein